MSYKIKNEVIWRRELGDLLIMPPSDRQLLIFKGGFNELIGLDGTIANREHYRNEKQLIDFLIKKNLVEEC